MRKTTFAQAIFWFFAVAILSSLVLACPKPQVSSYCVVYDAFSKTGGSVPLDSTSYLPGTTVTVLGNTGSLVRQGYSFAGWNTSSDGSGTTYQAGGQFVMGVESPVLYAMWTVDGSASTYTVTYAGNGNTGGSVPSDSAAYHQGDTVSVLGNTGTLVKTGYTFTGWNSQADGRGDSYPAGTTPTFVMGTSNVTLHASWTSNSVSGSYSLFSGGQVELKDPSYVNLLFQVQKSGSTDAVSNLTLSNFVATEDGAAIPFAESSIKIAHVTTQIPYTISTVLMLDNSNSIGATNLATLKSAAKALVATKVTQQKIAVYSFTGSSTLVCDFSSDATTLNSAIDSISLGAATTNLYGAVVTGAGRWTDSFAMAGITSGNLVVFTDGQDTAGLVTLQTALSACAGKKVIIVGASGASLDQSILQQLVNAGTAGSNACLVGDYSTLLGYFQQVQTAITNWANSFYWAYYLSPKLGSNSHTLSISLNGNTNTGTNSSVQGSFSSTNFYSVMPGMYVNDSSSQQTGISTLSLSPGVPVTVSAHSYLGANDSVYDWTFDTGGVTVTKAVVSSNPAEEKVSLTASAALPANSTMTVTDMANANYSKMLLLSPPPVPSIFSVEGGARIATATWGTVASAVSYNLYYGAGSTVSTATGTKVSGAVSPLTLTSLLDNTQYAFIVTSVNGFGESLKSPVVTAKTCPAAPVITGTNGDKQATVSWGAVPGAISYNLYNTAGASVSMTVGTRTTGVTSPLTITGLSNDTQYSFIVSAVNASGESAASNLVSIWPAKPWTIVGSAGFSTGSAFTNSLAIDSTGKPWIAFVDGSNKVTVMKFDGSAWATIGSAGFSAGSANYISLAIGPGDIPFVAYSDGTLVEKATVKKFNGTGWVTVGSAGFAGPAYWDSLAVDSSGVPSIAFVWGASSNMAVSSKYTGNWNGSGQISGSAATATSLAINSAGVQFVAYSIVGGKANVKTNLDGYTWTTVGTADISAGNSDYTSLALDSSGLPYVAFQDGANGNKVTVMKYNGSTWTTVGSVGFSDASAYYISLAVSPGGTPYVAFSTSISGENGMVMKYNGTFWIRVGSGLAVGQANYPNVKTDASGVPYVSYIDGTNGSKMTVMKLE